MSTVELKYPVSVDGKTYNSLTFRRPTVGDIAAQDLVTGETKKSAATLASIAGVPLQVILGLDILDYKRVAEETADFLSDLQATA